MRRLNALILTSVVAGCAVQGRAELAHEPRLTTCQSKAPSARPDYPSDFDQVWAVELARGLVSGYDFMWRYHASGTASPVVVQLIRVNRRRQDPCQSPAVGGDLAILEVFRAPAVDVIAAAMACESWQSDLVSGTVAIFDAAAADPEILAALRAIQPGQNVMGLNTRLAPAKFDTIVKDVEARAQIRWRAQLEYDGCNAADPATRCNRRHCAEVTWADTAAVTTRTFGGP